MTASDTKSVTVEKWVYGGRGLARAGGLVVLIPYVLPGEEVRFLVESRKPGLVNGRLLEVLTPSPLRVAPPCPYFGRCGGCHYQHAPYPFQLQAKRAILQEVLRRLGRLAAPASIELLTGPEFEYRNRAQFHIASGRIGFHRAGSHQLVDVERCAIASPGLNQALQELRSRRLPARLNSIEVFTNESQTQFRAVGCGPPALPLDYPAAGERFRVRPQSFFQVNRFLVDALVSACVPVEGGHSAWDLYAGVGLFSLPLARRFSRVTAVEPGYAEHSDLEFNASRAGLDVAALRLTAEDFLAAQDRAPDFVLADPPRAGLGKTVVRELLRLQPPRLALLSCDPATLARDLAALHAGGYHIARILLIDLFPQTAHLETAVWLHRREAPPDPEIARSSTPSPETAPDAG